MKTKAIFAFLIAIFAIAMVCTSVSAAILSTPILSTPIVRVDGMNVEGYNVSVIAGETYPITIQFTATDTADNVEVSAWIQGERQDRVDKVFADLIIDRDYKARLSVVIPEKLDGTEEEITLYVRVESDSGNWEGAYTLYAQREAYNLNVLLVNMNSNAKVGSTIPIDVVLKNLGRHEAEDTLVTVRIPELGISKTAYFEDLYPTDNTADKEYDSRERTLYLTIPETASAGTYQVEVTAKSDNTKTTVEKTLTLTKTLVEGSILSNPSGKTFAVGEEAVYELVLVNTGNKITVYNLAPQNSDALSIRLSDSIATVPAGQSEVVKVYVKANREGTFTFAIDANADNFSETATFTANVEGKSLTGGNNIVALTIVLAIVFVVLLVILIVLLTRKPETSEEFGESYY